jgi:hypothetical protein
VKDTKQHTGLTLIYCAWLAPPNYISVEGPLTDCQLLLYIVTERYPSARKYRDVFERIKKGVLDIIAQGKHEPRNPVSLEPVVANFNSQWAQGMGGMGSDFTFMINSMTGNPVTTPPPFDLGMDSATTPLVVGHSGQTPDLGQYQVWPELSHGSGELKMSDIDTMRGIFQ